jgi:putative transcriptional regulator
MDKEIVDFRIKLGKRIGQLRRRKGFEQTELAAILHGKDKQFINRYENQGANPSAYILVQLAKALEVTIDELCNFSDLND